MKTTMELPLPVHWRFAVGQALSELRELVLSFDFRRLAHGQTYVGVEPKYLLAVIDGFLGESDEVIYGGGRTELRHLRDALVSQIQPVHDQGLAAGRKYWHEGACAYGSLQTDDLHQLAIRSAPNNPMLQGWFAEGYCFAYSFEELQSLRPNQHS